MDRPNILFIVLDTARADTVYSMLSDGELPGLGAIAEQGTIFENAFSNAPWTLPSHASMFTGQRSSTHNTHAGNKVFDPTVPSLPEVLSGEGYRTIGISGNSWISSEFGFDRGFDELSTKWDRFWGGSDLSAIAKAEGLDIVNQAIRTLANRRFLTTTANIAYEKVLTTRDDFGTERTTDRTIRWLEANGSAEPFFFFINYLEPHLPYEPPTEFQEQFPTDSDPSDVNQDPWEYVAGTREMTQRDFETLYSLYKAEIAYLDSHLYRLYETLEKTQLLDETMIVVLGDHGENIGDHELMDHQYSLHETLLRVPLIVRYPEVFDADREGGLVELRDLYPTLLSVVGADYPSDSSISSVNLADSTYRDAVFAEYRYPQPDMQSLQETVSSLRDDYRELDATLRSVRTRDWKLIESEHGEVQLFAAGDETTDISDSNPRVVADLLKRMDEHGIKLERGQKTETQMDDQVEARLEDLGYL